MISENTENKAANRTSGIGGSDIAGICSLPPYGCARRTFFQKLGVKPDYPIAVEDCPIERGNDLESLILEKLERQTGMSIVPGDEVRDSQHPFLMAHPDGLAMKSGFGLIVAEAKAPGPFRLREFLRKGLGEDYVLQMNWYQGLTGLRGGVFALLDLESWKVRSFEVEPNPGLFSDAKAAAIDFWGQVQRGEEPPRLDPKSKQCARCEFRTSCQGAALLEMASEKDAGEIQERPDLVDIANAYDEAKRIAADASAYVDEVQEEFKAQLGEGCQAANIPGWRIYWRLQTAMRTDGKALEKRCRDHGETIKRYASMLATAPEEAIPDLVRDFEALAEEIATLPSAVKKPTVSRPFRYFPR